MKILMNYKQAYILNFYERNVYKNVCFKKENRYYLTLTSEMSERELKFQFTRIRKRVTHFSQSV